MARCSVLDKVYLPLIRYLNVNSVKPYLKQKQLLTDDELERLDLACSQSSQSGAETLVKMLKRKGPSHEGYFLSALKDSMEFDPHQGHHGIISALEAVVEEPDQDVERDFPRLNSKTASDDHLELEGDDSHILRRGALRSKVVKANNDIKMKFTKFVLDVYRLLMKKRVAVEEVRLGLLFLGCFKKSSKSTVISPASELSHAESIQSLIECLHEYSSWYNYHLIKFVATEFGKEEGTKIVDEYLSNLSSYCEKIIACQCPEFSLSDGLPPGYDHLVVKVDWDHTAQDIAIFQAELSSLLHLEPEVFILKGVEEGCVLVTWAVPQCITIHIVMETMKQQQLLAKWKVLAVRAAGKCIDIQMPKHKELIQAPLSPLKTSDNSSQSSFLSDYSDGPSVNTPLDRYDIAAMPAGELEIVSTYSGRSRNSMYSTVSSGGTIAPMKFHSECDILSQQSVHIRASNSLNVISKNPSKKKRTKTLLKSVLPKLFKARKKSDVTVIDDDKTRDGPVSTEFPILDLSEEPAMKLEGKHVYSHYYFGDEDNVISARKEGLLPATMDTTTNSELASTTLPLFVGLQIRSECSDNAAGTYGSKSDVESGLGSQNLANTTSEDNLQLFDTYTCVQRSQSMKCQCFNLDNSSKGGLSLRKLPQNMNPSLNALHQTSSDRVDTPSSGYGESQSGCCSIQSSLYSLSSNLPLDGPHGSDNLYHHEGLHACYHSSSLKRNSITSSGRPQSKEPKKSARSHSFNGKFTVHHN